MLKYLVHNNNEHTSFIESLINKVIEGQKGENILNEIEYYFSSTEDNISCGNQVKINKYKDIGKKTVKGLSFRDYSLSDIAYFGLEEEDKFFHFIKNKFPKLSEEEWSAFTRLVVLFFTSLERDI